jgi:hypothetical protein
VAKFLPGQPVPVEAIGDLPSPGARFSTVEERLRLKSPDRWTGTLTNLKRERGSSEKSSRLGLDPAFPKDSRDASAWPIPWLGPDPADSTS